MLVNSILVLFANQGAAMCTRLTMTEQEEGVCSYHYNLLSPWHRHTVVLNGWSSYSTVLQTQVKAEKGVLLAGESAPEHRTIALGANFIRDVATFDWTSPLLRYPISFHIILSLIA